VAVWLVYPRLGRPLLVLAGVVALSRVYLGVHFVLDVAAGTLLGIAVGIAAAWFVRRLAPAPTPCAASP
jgi:undecaprenyl-diphosphatase